MQFAAASGLSRAERCVVRAVHLGFPANASTWSSVTIRQSFVLVVAVSFLACLFVPGFHRSRDVRIDSHCHIYALLLHFPPPPPRSLDLFTQLDCHMMFLYRICKQMHGV